MNSRHAAHILAKARSTLVLLESADLLARIKARHAPTFAYARLEELIPRPISHLVLNEIAKQNKGGFHSDPLGFRIGRPFSHRPSLMAASSAYADAPSGKITKR